MSFCKWHREERGTRAPTCGEQAALGGYTGYSHDAQTSGKDWASGLRDHNRNCNGSGLIEIDVVWRPIVTILYKSFFVVAARCSRLHKRAKQHLRQLRTAAPEMHSQRIARALDLG